MKKVIIFITFFFSFLGAAKAEKVNVYFFTGEGCEYCNKALEYFYDNMEKYENYVDIKVYEVWNNKANNAFYGDLKKYNIIANTIPFTLVGDSFSINGYKEGQGAIILSKAYELSSNSSYQDLGKNILSKNPEAKAWTVKEALINEGIITEEGFIKEYLIISAIFMILILTGIILLKKAKII